MENLVNNNIIIKYNKSRIKTIITIVAQVLIQPQ